MLIHYFGIGVALSFAFAIIDQLFDVSNSDLMDLSEDGKNAICTLLVFFWPFLLLIGMAFLIGNFLGPFYGKFVIGCSFYVVEHSKKIARKISRPLKLITSMLKYFSLSKEQRDIYNAFKRELK